MNKKYILSFIIGAIVTLIIVFLFKPLKEEVSTKSIEGDVKGIYGKLVELGYTQDVPEDDIDVIVQKVTEASEWAPNGSVTASDVLEGKTFYNRSRDIQTGTYTPEEFTFLGDTSVEDVLTGNRFYSDSGELLTGTLVLPSTPIVSYKGSASVSDVLAGKTFYSNSGTLLTGIYTPPVVSYLGDTSVTDVMSGKKFYSNSSTLLTGTWSFLGDAGVDEVLDGKKFYSNSGTLLTGTYTPPTPIDFSNMQYSAYDNMGGVDYFGWFEKPLSPEDYHGEEAIWTYVSDNIWKDERAGIYWSSDQTPVMLSQDPPISNTNNFTEISLGVCDYFNSVPRSLYDGLDADCGNAINWCAELELDGRSNWYLPSTKRVNVSIYRWDV